MNDDLGPDGEPQWQERMDIALVLAALVFLVAYALPILHPGLPAAVDVLCRVLAVVIWVMFLVDLAVRLFTAHDRRAYLRRNWPAVAAVVFPVLRPAYALVVLGRRNRRFERGQVVGSVLVAAASLLALAVLVVLQAERGQPGANIETVQQALWWSVVTISTVGYGDYYPVTTQGRLTAFVLMTTGVALVGVISASLASWFVERVSANRGESHADPGADGTQGSSQSSPADDLVVKAVQGAGPGTDAAAIAELTAQIRELRAEVARLSEGWNARETNE